MNFLEQVKTWLGLRPADMPDAIELRQRLDAGRRAKQDEDYPAAYEAFERAYQYAASLPARDKTILNIIQLHQADILIRQGQWDAAEKLLNDIKAAAAPGSAHHAYTVDVFGTLAFSRGDFTAARSYHEQALKEAKVANALGAQGRALGHQAQIYLSEGNASYAAHLLKECLPLLNSSGDIELSSYFVGLLGEAQVTSGQDAEGEQLLLRALRLADQMQYRMYRRRWRLALAAHTARNSRYEEARNYYQQALELFGKRPPTPEHIEALCMASQVSLNLGYTGEALDYAKQAHTMSTELNVENVLAQGALGMALRASSQNAEALPYLETAAQAVERTDSTIPAAVRVNILRSLAAAQGETQPDTELPAATFKRAITLAQKLSVRLEEAQSQRDLGLLYASRKLLTQALQAWNAALTIYQDEHYTAQVARLYCDMGNARKTLGQGQRAMKDYEQALTLLNSISDQDTRGVVLSNAAIAYADMGEIESADQFFSEAINIAHKSGDFRAEATRRGNHAWFLLVTGRARRATSALEQVLHLSRQMNLELQVAVQTDNLGLAHDELNEYEVAIHYHMQALELIKPLANSHWEYVIKTNAANTLRALGRQDEALPLLQEALAYGRGVEDHEVITRALLGLARAAMQRKEYAEAGEMLNEAVSLARRTDIRFLLALTLEAYSEQQASVGQNERALSLWNEAQKLFGVMHNPRTGSQPGWLNGAPVETSSS
ncbi:MAG: tetratricopeptide repeat protein [Anaerolineae bacterium]